MAHDFATNVYPLPTDAPAEIRVVTWLVLGGFMSLLFAVGALLVWGAFQGRQVARLLLVVLVTTSLVSQVLQFLGPRERPPVLTLFGMSLDLFTLFALTSLTARAWTRERGPERRAQRRRRQDAISGTR